MRIWLDQTVIAQISTAADVQAGAIIQVEVTRLALGEKPMPTKTPDFLLRSHAHRSNHTNSASKLPLLANAHKRGPGADHEGF